MARRERNLNFLVKLRKSHLTLAGNGKANLNIILKLTCGAIIYIMTFVLKKKKKSGVFLRTNYVAVIARIIVGSEIAWGIPL